MYLIFHKQGQLFFQFLPIFFILVWLDEFGKTCGRFENQNVEDHISKCLGQYYNLQKGLGKSRKKDTFKKHVFHVCFKFKDLLLS